MSRLLSRLIVPFVTLSALAQTATEAPTERASGAVVVIFVLLFIGMCVGIAWMAIASGRREKRELEALAKRNVGG